MRLFLTAALVIAGLGSTAAVAATRDTTLKISADKALLRYDRSALVAKAGKVTIVMTNPSILMHNVAVKGNGVNVKGKVVGKGGVSSISASFKPGTYTFYCTVPGHEAGGMKGTLTVR